MNMSMTIKLWNRRYYFIPFLIMCGILLFCFFLIIGAAYKYHEETTERIEKIQKIDIPARAKALNEKLYQKNEELQAEITHLKSAPYELIRDDGTKEYYSLVTHQLLKKIDKDETVWEYDPNSGILLKLTDKYHKITEYDSNGKIIKETLSNGTWTEFNPLNDKMIKRKNIDGSLEEFDENEKKIKEYKYHKDTNKIQSLIDFDVNTGKRVKGTQYRDDGKTIDYIIEYNKDTGNWVKYTYYQDDGKTIDRIVN